MENYFDELEKSLCVIRSLAKILDTALVSEPEENIAGAISLSEIIYKESDRAFDIYKKLLLKFQPQSIVRFEAYGDLLVLCFCANHFIAQQVFEVDIFCLFAEIVVYKVHHCALAAV